MLVCVGVRPSSTAASWAATSWTSRHTSPGLEPITVDPAVQNRTVGRHLMEHMLTRVRDGDRPGVRLLQATYHNRSLCLYVKLGFRHPGVAVQRPGAGAELHESRLRRAAGNGR